MSDALHLSECDIASQSASSRGFLLSGHKAGDSNKEIIMLSGSHMMPSFETIRQLLVPFSRNNVSLGTVEKQRKAIQRDQVQERSVGEASVAFGRTFRTP